MSDSWPNPPWYVDEKITTMKISAVAKYVAFGVAKSVKGIQ